MEPERNRLYCEQWFCDTAITGSCPQNGQEMWSPSSRFILLYERDVYLSAQGKINLACCLVVKVEFKW